MYFQEKQQVDIKYFHKANTETINVLKKNFFPKSFSTQRSKSNSLVVCSDMLMALTAPAGGK